MAIITISRGSYSRGKEIAEKLADKLGYKCLSRDVLLEASEHFNIPEVKLVRALHDAPSILNRFTFGREKYIAFIREALLEAVQPGNVIYHGLAGHFLLKEVHHVMKVRIIANMDDRIREEMKRENLSEEKARHVLQKDDHERKKWGQFLYNIDTSDASLYDIVLHIDSLTVDDAVEILLETAKRECFQRTPESKKILDNMVISAQAQVLLLDKFPRTRVACKDGVVHVNVETPSSHDEKITAQINELLGGVEGIDSVKVHIVPMVTPD